jgi:hypothetical protein
MREGNFVGERIGCGDMRGGRGLEIPSRGGRVTVGAADEGGKNMNTD